MSATPIPRTLQMSLSGLKEMSLIETPPVNRKSVQTYVLKTNESVIREAIYREMARSGQVFYLLNKIICVFTIEKCKRGRYNTEYCSSWLPPQVRTCSVTQRRTASSPML